MTYKSRIMTVVAAALTLTSIAGLTQERARDRAQADRQQQVDRDRTFDRGRQDRDRMDASDRERARDRSRVHVTDPSQLKDRDIYGYRLMTEQERNEYREQLQKAETAKERDKLMAQHREKMQARAAEQGIKLDEVEEAE